MSAIASFTKLPKSALDGLRGSAGSGTVYEYLSANGSDVADYHWSGYVLTTLLPYLDEEHQIDLMKSEYDELGTLLTENSGVSYFIFTPSHRAAFLDRLEPELFSEEQMRRYFNEFNETNEQEIGQAMLDGVIAIQKSLRQIDDNAVVIFGIG